MKKNVQGSRKGSQFERDIAKQLSLWLSNGKDSYILARRMGSGGSQKDKRGFTNSTGDIYSDKKEGNLLTDKFSLELKNYKNLNSSVWFFLCNMNKGLIPAFIQQAKNDANIKNRFFMLVLKQNRYPVLIISDYLDFKTQLSKVKEGYFLSNKYIVFPFFSFLKLSPIFLKNSKIF